MPAPLVLPAPSPPAPTTTQGSTFIWIMRIAVSNVVSEYSLGGVNLAPRVRDMMFECGTGYEVRDMRYVVHSVTYG